MATRGRKPVPSAIKLIQGNPGRRPINKREPKPKPKVPSPPSALKGEALREWKRITKVLGPMWMLSDLDRAVLAAYCTAYARWKAATDGITAAAKSTGHGGLLVETRNGNLIQNPLVGIQRRAAEGFDKDILCKVLSSSWQPHQSFWFVDILVWVWLIAKFEFGKVW